MFFQLMISIEAVLVVGYLTTDLRRLGEVVCMRLEEFRRGFHKQYRMYLLVGDDCHRMELLLDDEEKELKNDDYMHCLQNDDSNATTKGKKKRKEEKRKKI